MHLLDSQGATFSLLFVGLVEVVVIMHVYGKKKKLLYQILSLLYAL